MERPEAQTSRIAELSLTIEAAAFPALFCLLQRGFLLEVEVAVTVNELLCGQLGIAPDYVAGSISTVFLNGRPVDDLDRATVNDGATVALSSAMPGLLGAVMRSGSPLASFRGTISHREREAGEGSSSGRVRLKLFNRIMSDLGPGFLRTGILVPPPLLMECLAGPGTTSAGVRESIEAAAIRTARLDGRPVAFERLLEPGTFSGIDLVLLSVRSDG